MIHFLIGVVVIGAIIMMMAASPAFRNFVIVAIVVVVGALWLIISNQNRESEKLKKAQEAQEYIAAAAIKEADLKFENVKLMPASYGLDDFILSGTVTNDSNSQLGTIFFQITITDYQGNDCRIVGQKDQSASVKVPAKQMRTFSSYAIRFENLPPVGTVKRSWNYKITGLRTG